MKDPAHSDPGHPDHAQMSRFGADDNRVNLQQHDRQLQIRESEIRAALKDAGPSTPTQHPPLSPPPACRRSTNTQVANGPRRTGNYNRCSW